MDKIQAETRKRRPGDCVRVKSPQEILDTLDDNFGLENMPFMPEMFDSCGQVFLIAARADKTCDTATRTGGRELADSVHLQGQRCDGSAHGGCQAACLNFWKEEWLELVESNNSGEKSVNYSPDVIESAKTSVTENTHMNSGDGDAPVYSCQATRLPDFTKPLSPWNWRQYWRDATTNGVALSRMIKIAFISLYMKIVATGVAYQFWVSAYDWVQRRRNRHPWPFRSGTLVSTPVELLGLEVGEYVRVKSFAEILETLDTNNKNRGLFFDAEMVRFCGSTYRVNSRVSKIINEETGEMMNFGNPCIILEDVWCSSDWSTCRRFCPRSIYHYWRENWLERMPSPDSAKTP